MEWLALFALMLGVIALIAGLGWLALFAMGLSPRTALLYSPAVGLGILGILTLFNGVVGWHWGWWQVIVVLLVLGALALLAGSRRMATKTTPMGPDFSTSALGFGAGGVLIFALAQLLAFWKITGSPTSVQSFGDAQFHYNGIQLIIDGASTSPFGGLAGLYNPAGIGSNYYPTLWHSLVSLFAGGDQIALASNAVMLVVTAVFWPWTLASVALTIAPRKSIAALATPAAALLMTIFPATIVYQIAIHPLGLGLSFLPGAIALVLLCVSMPRSPWIYVAVAVATAGMFCAHPSIGLLLVIVIGVAVLVMETVGLKALWARGRRLWAAALGGGTLVLIAVVLGVLLTSNYARNLAEFGRVSAPYSTVIGRMFTGSFVTSSGTTSFSLTGLWLLVFAFSLFGIWKSRHRVATWVLVVSGIGYTILYVLAGGPENRLRALSGPWWKDDMRLIVPVVIVTLALAGIGFAYALTWLNQALGRRVVAWVAVGLVVVAGLALIILPSALLAWNSLVGNVLLGYSLSEDEPSVLNEDSVTVLEAARDEFGKGEVVVGPYSSGVGFISVFSDANSFFPKPRYDTADQKLLAKYFDQILEDPRVCEVVEQYNITGLMVDTPDPQFLETAFEGFYNTNTAEGFELVASSGGVSLYRITACD